jgi:hypothetical protein
VHLPDIFAQARGIQDAEPFDTHISRLYDTYLRSFSNLFAAFQGWHR